VGGLPLITWPARPALGILSILFLAACSTTAEPTKPTTPRVEEPEAQEELEEVLPTLSEVASTPGAPQGLVQQQVEDAELYENPDPRGPCGAEVYQPPMDEGSLAVFATSSPPTQVGVSVVKLEPHLARQAVGDIREDIRPGCPPFESGTPTGVQRVEFVGEVDLSGIGDESAGAVARLDIGVDAPLEAAAALVREESILISVFVYSERPVSEEFVASLAELATGKVAEAP